MPLFKQRSTEKELLDGTGIPFKDIQQNLRELNIINHWLGGHRITLEGAKAFSCYSIPGASLHILEIGCGGGDNLRVIGQWAQKNKISVQLTGVDINEQCIRVAQKDPLNRNTRFIAADYKKAYISPLPHVIFSSLFCHHFTDEEVVFMLQWMAKHAQLGFFINDLHRHPLAYYSIRAVTRFFSKSYLVKNDAPLSVLRGFSSTDWYRLFELAGLSEYSLKWRWAFRWLACYHHANERGKGTI